MMKLTLSDRGEKIIKVLIPTTSESNYIIRYNLFTVVIKLTEITFMEL